MESPGCFAASAWYLFLIEISYLVSWLVWAAEGKDMYAGWQVRAGRMVDASWLVFAGWVIFFRATWYKWMGKHDVTRSTRRVGGFLKRAVLATICMSTPVLSVVFYNSKRSCLSSRFCETKQRTENA